MDRLRGQLLAGARLAGNEHRHFGGGHLADQVKDCTDSGARSHHFVHGSHKHLPSVDSSTDIPGSCLS